ncbi:MAG: DUF3256 family protein [Bacteroidales bacterium OttesenSCG-928-I14]|jgi:hypothetical protein|nr:DUF3256 family protein [Bacteroidales bacterium OttesenSCG-928-I14]
MKKKYIIRIILEIISLPAVLLYPKSAKDVFLSMPESTFLYLNSFSRTNLMNLYDAYHSQSIVTNVFGDTVTLKTLTMNYLLLKIKNASFQLIILPILNKTRIYCTIYTICESACDSYIEFYSTSWKRIKKYTTNISVKKECCTNENLDFITFITLFTQLEYNPNFFLLQQFYNTPDLTVKNQKKIQLFIKKQVKIYKWNGFQFE